MFGLGGLLLLDFQGASDLGKRPFWGGLGSEPLGFLLARELELELTRFLAALLPTFFEREEKIKKKTSLSKKAENIFDGTGGKEMVSFLENKVKKICKKSSWRILKSNLWQYRRAVLCFR